MGKFLLSSFLTLLGITTLGSAAAKGAGVKPEGADDLPLGNGTKHLGTGGNFLKGVSSYLQTFGSEGLEKNMAWIATGLAAATGLTFALPKGGDWGKLKGWAFAIPVVAALYFGLGPYVKEHFNIQSAGTGIGYTANLNRRFGSHSGQGYQRSPLVQRMSYDFTQNTPAASEAAYKPTEQAVGFGSSFEATYASFQKKPALPATGVDVTNVSALMELSIPKGHEKALQVIYGANRGMERMAFDNPTVTQGAKNNTEIRPNTGQGPEIDTYDLEDV